MRLAELPKATDCRLSPSITWWMRRLLVACEVGFWPGRGRLWLVIVIATSARTGVPSIRNSVYLTVALVMNPLS